MHGRQQPRGSIRRLSAPFGALTLLAAWTLIWLQLNADWPGVLDGEASFSILRGLLPLVVGVLLTGWWLACCGGLPDRFELDVDLAHPMTLLAAFGLVGALGALVRSPDRVRSLYWAVTFLVPVGIVAVATTDQTLLEARDFFHLTLAIVASVATVLLAYFAYEAQLFQALVGLDLSRIGTTYGDAPVQALTINANGTGRFAALTLLLATSFLLTARSWLGKGLSLVALFGFGTLLVFTQSRGAILGFLFGLFLLLGLHKGWKRTGGALGATLVAGGVFFREEVLSYLTRGDWTNVFTLTGRTRIWESLWPYILDAPLIGWGFWADRLLVDEEAHDALIGALITSGLLGTLLFLAAWAVVWWFVIEDGLGSRFGWLGEVDRNGAILATAILGFLTVRSIPESTGTFFGVDLLVLVPVMGFLYSLKTRPTDASSGEAHAGPHDEPRVLACAYACSPPGSPSFRGGETLLGWRLTEQIAGRSELTVLVSAEHRESIEASKNHLDARFVAIDLPSIFHPLRRVQGGIQLYAYLWQIKAYFVARRLHRESPVDLFHHITYANDWMASYIGAYLDVPYVRGPGGGAQQVPDDFASDRSLRFRLAQAWRAGMQKLLRLDPVYRRSQDNADKLLVCTRESWRTFPQRWREKTEMFPVNGIDPEAFPESSEQSNEEFTVLSAGKLLEIKGFDLAIHAFADFADRNEEGRLLIVGDGPDRRRLEQFAVDLGVEDRVEFLGWQAHDEVLQRMVDADVFLFASLRDGGGGVVVEAMAAGTPVVCLDHAGPGYHTRNGAGLAIEPSHPKLASLEMADALEDLYLEGDLRDEIGERGKQRAMSGYRWEDHGDRIASIYKEVLGSSPSQRDTAEREEEVAELPKAPVEEVSEPVESAGGEPT